MGESSPFGLTIYGSGKVAQALAKSLRGHMPIYISTPQRERGLNIAKLLGIKFAPFDGPPPTRDVIIARRDSDIKATGEHIARFGQDRVVLHTSGALPSDIIPLNHRGSLHPVRSITEHTDLTGTTFVFEGTAEGKQLAQRIVNELRGKLLTIDIKDKLKYHAALSLMSQAIGVSTLLALNTLKDLGIEDIEEALGELGESALHNALTMGTKGLTGPAARGDLHLIAAEEQTLQGCARKLYRLVSDIVVLLKGEGG